MHDTIHPLPAEQRGEHWWLQTEQREVRLSNLDKVFFPDLGYTKGDVLSYYWHMRDRVLPYLIGRPLTIIFFPDGVKGKRLLMKDPPSHAPDWLPTCHIPHFTEGGRSNDFPMITDESHLMYLANLACIDFHPLHARCDEPAAPDYALFDLDPADGATFEDVRIIAMHIRAALDALKLPSYVKSTGASGLHVYVPIERNVSFNSTRDLVRTIAVAVRKADPQRVSLELAVKARRGKVFIDHNMNRRGQNTVSAWSIRPEPTATVAVPVTWDEVEEGFEPTDWDLTVANERDADPMLPMTVDRVDIRPAMEKLGVEATLPV